MQKRCSFRRRTLFSVFKISLILIIVAFSGSSVVAQRVASVTGNWNNIATWGGQPVPTASETVTINSGITVTVSAAGAECSSLTFVSNAVNSTVTISGAFALAVSGDITFSNPAASRIQAINIGAGSLTCTNLNYFNTSSATQDNNVTITTGTLTATGNISMPGATTENALTCTGASNINIGGNFTGTGTFTQSTSNVIFNGASSQSIRLATFSRVEINKTAGVASLLGAVTVSGRLTLTEGTVDLNGGNLAVGSLIGAGSITANGIAARTLTVGTDNTSHSFSGNIQNGSMAVSLTKSGTGTLTLSGVNTYTGATLISAGTLTLGLAGVIPNVSALTVTGSLDLNGFDETIGSLAGAGTVTNSGGGTPVLTTGGNNTATTYSGILQDGTGVVSLTKAGSGAMTLSGSSSYTGLTTISAGTITLGAAGNGTNSPLGTIAAGTLVNSGGTLNMNGINLSTSEDLTLNGTGAGGVGALNNASTTINSTYSGLITLGSPSSIFTAAGGLNITNPGTITGSGFALTLSGAGNGNLLSILGTDAGNLTKNGAGIWTLSAENTYTGLTTIGVGTLRLGTAGNGTNSPLGTVAAGTSITSGAALDLNGISLSTEEALIINGTGITSGGALTNSSVTAVSYPGLLTLGAVSTISTNAGTINLTNTGTVTGAFALTLSGSGNGSVSSVLGTAAGSLVKLGTGTWTLIGNATYTGVTTITAGTLKLGAAGVIPNISALTVTGILDLNGFDETVGSSAGAGTVTTGVAGASTLTTGGNNVATTTFSGIIQDGAGTLNLTKAGTGIMVLSGLSTYTGLTTINAGTVSLGAAGNSTNAPLGTIAAGTIVNTGGALNLNGITLSIEESVTLNGTGVAAAGALYNSSAVSVDFGGLVTLGSAASIVSSTAGVALNLTNAGTITGSGNALTLGGAGNGNMLSIIGTGSGTLTKAGTGIWTLSRENTHAGLTTIAAGTIRLGVAGNGVNGPLGTTGAGTAITAGAALDLNGISLSTEEALTVNGTGIASGGALTNSSVTAVNYPGLLTIGAASTISTNAGEINISNTGTVTGAFALTIGGSGNGRIAGILGISTGSVTKTGAGTWTLSGISTYTGATTISAGIVKIGADGAGMFNSSVTLTSSLDLNGFNSTIGSLAGAGTVTSSLPGSVGLTTGGNNVATSTFSGIIEDGSGTLSLLKSGTGIMIVSGLSSYSGLTTVNGGTLTLGATGNSTNGPLGTILSGTTVNTGAALNVNGFTLSTDEPLTLNGTGIAAAGALYNGSLTLSANYTGSIALGSASGIVSTTAGVALNLTAASITGAGFDLSLGGAGNGTVTSVINTGAGSLSKIGAGAWTLSAANQHAGGTTMNGGTLNIANSQALGDLTGTFTIITGTINNTSGASLTTSNYPMLWSGSFTFTGTQPLNFGTGTLTLNANVTVTVGSNNLTVAGIISGPAFNLSKAGAGNLSLGSNDVAVNGLTISAGTFLSTSGTLSINGIYTNNSTFNHNNGTTAFTGSIAQTIGGTVVSQSFYNLVVNKTLALTSTGSITTLTVNNYTHTQGSFTPPATFNVSGDILLTAGTFISGTTINLTGNWINNGATFTPGTGSVNFVGTSQSISGTGTTSFNSIVINSGATLTGPAGNLNIAGNWTNNGGTYVYGTGTVVFNGAAAQAINGTSTTQPFYNIVINKTLALTAPATLTIGGDFTLNLGSFTAGSGTVVFNGTNQAIVAAVALTFNHLTVDPGSTLTAPATMNISGSLNVNGAFNHNSGSLTFTGLNASVNSSSATLNLNNVVLNKTAANSLSFGGSLTSVATNNFTQTQGDVTGPDALTINGNAVFTAGNFTAGSATTIYGNWTKAVAAIFTPGSNTVTFAGTGAQSITGAATSQTFYNLVVNKTTGTLLNIGVTTVALIVNDLTLTQGNFTPPATLTINGDALLAQGTFTAGTSILARGNWTNNGGTFVPGLNTVSFTGTGAQQIAGTASPQVFYNVTVNKTALSVLNVAGSVGEMRVNNFVETQGDFNAPAIFDIDGSVTLTAGTFTAGATTHASANWTNNAAFAHGNGKVIFNGVAAQAIGGTSATSYYDMEVANTAAILTVNTNIDVANSLNMAGATTQLNPIAAVVINSGATAGTISGNGTIRITRIVATADYLNQYRFVTNTLNSMTLNFSGAGNQALNGGLGDLGALTLSVSGTKTMPGSPVNILGNFTLSGTAVATAGASLSVGGNVILGTGTTFSAGAFVHNVTGNWTNNGGTFTTAGSTINFNNSTGSQSINGTAASQTFFSLQLANTGQNLSLGGSTTTLNIGGNWINDGGFSGSGTITFTGAGGSISGTNSTAFPILQIGNGATTTLDNNNSSTALNFIGTSINSSLTHGSTTALNVNGNVTISQPTTTGRANSWNINGGSSTVTGLISFAGATTTSRIGRITITTGVLNADDGISFAGTTAANKVIDMTGGAGVINLKGILTIPAGSATLNAGTSGSIFNYADNNAQTVNYFSVGGYNNLHLNNTNPAGVSLSGNITTTNVRGNVVVGNLAPSSLFSTGDFNIALNNSQGLTITDGSVMEAGLSVITGATLSQINIDGVFKTKNTSGFSGSATTAISSVNSPAITLGVNSIVDYNALSGSQSVSAFSYNNLSMSNTSGVQTAVGNLTVNESLTLAAGGFNVAANTMTLNGPAIAGTANSLQASGSSSLIFGGTSSGVSIPSSVSALNNLTLNNTNGVILNSDLNIQGILGFTSGRLVTNTNKVIIASAGSVNNAGQASGWVNGNLEKNFATSNPGNFEIGDTNYYTPLGLTFASITSPGLVTAKSFSGDHSSAGSSALTPSKSVNRYWSLANSGVVFSTADVALAWNLGDNDPGLSASNLRVAKYSAGTWTRPAASSPTTSSILASGISSFSDFIVGEAANDYTPVITSNGATGTAGISISEGSTTITTVTATDADILTTLVYTINGGSDAAKFSMDPNTGVLTLLAVPDFESPVDADVNNTYIVNVRSSDGTNFDEQLITVSVTNVNEFTPVITSNGGNAVATINLNENIALATTIVATDNDNTTPLYSIIGGDDASRFTISNLGSLSFVNTPDFESPADLNTDNSYLVTVRASDGTNSDDQTITVVITDVNDLTPEITIAQIFTLDENSSLNTIAGTVQASDGDANTTYQNWTITSGNSGNGFLIDALTGVIRVSSPAALDYETIPEFNLSMTVSDGLNTSASRTVKVTLTDLNDNSPVITSNGGNAIATINLNENITVVTTVVAADTDNTTPLYSITGGDDASKFSLTNLGVLTFINPPDFEVPADLNTDNTYIVFVRASDGTNFDDQTIAVVVNGVNEVVPEVLPGQVFTLDENSMMDAIAGTVQVSDGDTNTTYQNWAIISGNSSNAFSIDPLTGSIKVSNPAGLDYEIVREFNLSINVSDGLNTSINRGVKVKLNNLNDSSPKINSNGGTSEATLTIPENSRAVTTMLATDADSAAMEYSINGGADASKFTIESQTGVITFTLAPDFENPGDANADNLYLIIARASDGKLFTDQTISVKVSNANDSTPDIAANQVFTISEKSLVNTIVGKISASDKDGIIASPVWTIVSGNLDNAFSINSEGTLTVRTTTNLNYLLTPVFTLGVSLSDGLNISLTQTVLVKLTQAVTVTLNRVIARQPPTGINWVTAELTSSSAGGSLVGTLSSTSADASDIFTYSLVAGQGDENNSLFQVVGDKVLSSGSFNNTSDQTNSIRISSKTQHGLSFEKIFSVTVIHRNLPPSMNAVASISTCYTSALGTIMLNGISPGPESAQNVTLSVVSDNNNLFGSLNVSGVSDGSAVLNYLLKNDVSGSATITVTLTDDGPTTNGGVNSHKMSFLLTINAAPAVSISSDKGLSISKGEIVELTAAGGVSYIWANAAGIIGNQNTSQLRVRPELNTTYQVTSLNASGCTSTESIAINVASDFKAIESTNVITPNADGKNDNWVVKNLDLYPNNEVSVFDKAGRLIFNKKGYTNSWDATINGSPLHEGTYYYYVDFGPGLTKMKGYITIVKD